MPRYAITDIHGCSGTFARLLDRISLGRNDELYLLGDYIDRGPDSLAVLEKIWQLREQGFHVSCLRGNHEQMLLDAVHHRRTPWDFAPRRQDLPRIIDWMEGLPHYLEIPGYLLVHAGLSFEEREPLLDTRAMLWARDWEHTLDRQWLGNRVILYGHTPRPAAVVAEEVRTMTESGLACLDAGCAMPYVGMGSLAALDLDARTVVFEARVD